MRNEMMIGLVVLVVGCSVRAVGTCTMDGGIAPIDAFEPDASGMLVEDAAALEDAGAMEMPDASPSRPDSGVMCDESNCSGVGVCSRNVCRTTCPNGTVIECAQIDASFRYCDFDSATGQYLCGNCRGNVECAPGQDCINWLCQ